MPVPTTIGTSVLRVLHRIQRQLSDLRERLERGPRLFRAAEVNVKHCEEALVGVKNEARALRVDVDKKQLQLKSGEDKVKELRMKLNTATNNREYQALLEQIAAVEMTNSVLADEILDALEKSDNFGKEIVAAESALSGAKKRSKRCGKKLPGKSSRCGPT
jgi:uncharacterized protein